MKRLRWLALVAAIGAAALYGDLNAASTTCAVNKFLNSTSPPPSGCLTLPVTSVFGRATGAIVAAIGDYTRSQLYDDTFEPQGRLTLTSGTPVLTATVGGATTIYYTPYRGHLVPVYNGSTFVPLACNEVTNSTTASSAGSAGPIAVANNAVYDLYIWSNAGVCTLTRSPAWTGASNRGTGAGTAEQQRITGGLLTNKQAITNGPGANRGTYVGTVASNGSAAIDYIFGAAASGGTAGRFAVYNYYNRVGTNSSVTDSGASYTYSSATIRQARASAAMQTTVLYGALEGSIIYTLDMTETHAAAIGAFIRWGVGLGTTTTFSDNSTLVQNVAAQAGVVALTKAGTLTPALGLNVISANEQGDGTNTETISAGTSSRLSVGVVN